MDLRIQRTKTAIHSAFIELRRKKPIEKITVTELSKLAHINKATFYLHYADIYDLSDEVENEAIDGILTDLKMLDRLFDNPDRFMQEIMQAFIDRRQSLDCLFSGSRRWIYADKVEHHTKSILYEKYPWLHTESNDIIITFMVQGVMNTIKDADNENTERIYGELVRINSEIISNLKPM